METNFAEYFKQAELSDADMVITVMPSEAAEATKKRRRDAAVLSTWPCHQLILRKSEYFRSQVQRWQQDNSCSSVSTRRSSSASSSAQSRPQLQLTVDTKEQVVAAEAVIAAMYGVKDALKSLPQQQLLQAVLVADRIQVTAVAGQAGALLLAEAQSQQGLAAAAMAGLFRLTAWPSCLAPLLPAMIKRCSCCSGNAADLQTILADGNSSSVQRLLVRVLGDLEAVWADEQLQAALLALPLPAMQLLLSSDQLMVASEDTVMFTAQQYVKAQHTGTAEATARLAALIRCPQLSMFSLSTVALSSDESLLLSCHQRQLRQLLSLRHVASPDKVLASVQSTMPAAPGSWQQVPRQIKQVGEVKVVWRLPVEQIMQQCRASNTSNKEQWKNGPSSPPFAGLAWRVEVRSSPGDGGVELGLYAGPVEGPAGCYYKCKFSLQCGSIHCTSNSPAPRLTRQSWGWKDFFEFDPMRGGWDEAAWAAKGLPTSGELEVVLTVLNVE